MIHFHKKISLAGLLLIASALVVKAQVLPLDPAVRTGKLPNGFTYYIRHNEEPKNRVVLYLANKVGSILETDDQQGLAHFMEHMSFNGTRHFPKNELVNYLQKSGVRFGADLNAYTGFDETVYQLPLPTDKPEILANGLQIMRDWAQEATLDATEIDKERGVVLEEKRLGKGAKERMQRLYFPLLLNRSRYSERLPIGKEDVLTSFKPEVIRRYYHDWYRPDLQALIVVGDIDVAAMEKQIKARFGDLKNPAAEKARIKYTVPLTGKNQFIAVTDKEMPVMAAQVLIKQPALTLHTRVDYRTSITRELINQMLTGRIGELSQRPDPPFAQAGAGIGEFMGGLDNFELTVVAKPGELEGGFKAAWREVERMKRFGFTETELQRAKSAYLSRLESALKEKNKTNSESYVTEYLAYFLKGTAAPGIDKEYDLTTTLLPAISLAEVNTLAKSEIKDKDRDILILAPEKEKAGLPADAAMQSWIKVVADENITAYKDQVSSLSLLQHEPPAGKTESSSTDKTTGITTLKLSNGVTVILKPTDFKADEILFTGFSTGGTSLYSDRDFQSASNAGNIIPSFGAGNYTETELEKYLAGKQLAVQPYIGERTQGVNGAATPKDLETALRLIYAYYTEPRKDTALFASIISRSRAGLANRANDPANVFRDTVSAVLGNYSIRRTGPSVEKLSQVDLEKASQVFRERFGNASGTVFTFVGSFDPKTIQPLLEKYLGGLPSAGAAVPAKDLGIQPPAGEVVKTVYKGSEPKATVQLVWSGEFDYSPKENIVLDALKECLDIRLLERLREDESGVYSPSAFANPVKLPRQRCTIGVYFGCGPQNVEKLIASVLDETAKLRTAGPPQVNVDKWRAESLREEENEVKTNKWWLNYLNGQNLNQEPLDEYQLHTGLINAVTPEMVRSAAQKYLSGKNYIRLVLLPENAPSQ